MGGKNIVTKNETSRKYETADMDDMVYKCLGKSATET